MAFSNIFLFFQRKPSLTFHVNGLLSKKIGLDISCEWADHSHEMSRLISLKNKKNSECCLMQFVVGI